MPPKRSRREEAGSDSEAESSQAQKRVRTSDESEEERTVPTRQEAKFDEQGSDLEDNEEFEEPEELDEDEEKRFEEEHEAELRERVAQVKAQGNIAEMGIIEKIEMHQFMCHKYLEFNFGPQINFIIGHNGSGKSAVLSALTVALGGKANVTGRGSGLKSFIREGQGAAEVTVTLKNQGEDAYKQQDYGDSIVITRRFTKENSSSYRIKSKSGKTISTKREELSAICDHMNIQVDNPMNILTQDSARQFLSASAPADKYKFFLRGTQLSQLSEEYSTCLENISQTQRILKTKTDALPDLVQAHQDALARYNEAKKAREMKKRVNELTAELAWAHVAAKEREFSTKLEEVAQQEAGMPRLLERLKDKEEQLTIAEEQLRVREEEHELMADPDDLRKQRDEVKKKINENKDQLSKIKDDERQLNNTVHGLTIQIEMLQQKIADEQRKQEQQTMGRRLEVQERLDQISKDLIAAEERQKELQKERQEILEQGGKADRETKEFIRIGENLKGDIEGAQNQLQRLSERERSKLAPFGSHMEQVLAEIGNRQWYGQQPVGPLGRYVTLRDPKRWGDVMRVMIGHSMSAFAVSDARDRKPLEEILKRYGNRANIIISPVDLFDFSAGEPPENYLTVLRALDVSDPYVLRVLINSNSIERTLLASSRREGDQALVSLGGGGVAWTADFFSVRRFPEGGGQSSLLPPLNRNGDPRMQLFTTDDLEAQKQHWRQRLHEAQEHYQAKAEESKLLRDVTARCRSRKAEIENELAQLNRTIRQLKQERGGLQDELEQSEPLEIQGIQENLREAKEEKDNAIAQFADIAESMAKLNQAQHPLMEEDKRLKTLIGNFTASKKKALAAMQDAAAERVQIQSDIKYYEDKIAEQKAKVAVAKEGAEVLEEEFKNWSEQAEKISKRVPNPRDAEEVKRHLESSKRALQAQQKKNPVSVDDLLKILNAKKNAMETAKTELKMMVSLNKSLRKSIKTRLTRWHEFRRHIALRCKIYFSYHLSQRGYFGKVLFDHVNGTLQLKVQTDDVAATQAANAEKDPRSLSGGEKSFSTICLLLSLWESIGCPIRCLDEFDVFMDAVNRRISMKMMIDTANASDRKQYILITPQDMNNVHITNTVRVHRMTDPERGQGVLRFSGAS
ncbi:hypothetical protein EIP86_006532 [Pleurotus ostreatoroseus]|nr:hypothetical protein EIP86_006532 [Pleurotus ostreatoroseus]